jgi:hypothetical protein
MFFHRNRSRARFRLRIIGRVDRSLGRLDAGDKISSVNGSY